MPFVRFGPAGGRRVGFLERYSGYLHADAYTGYDAMFSDIGSNVIEVACWSHARRKFFDGVKSYPRESHQMLEWIRQLYDIVPLNISAVGRNGTNALL